MCLYIYKYKYYIDSYNLIHLYDITCMNALTDDHLVLDRVHSQHSSVTCSSMCRVEAFGLTPVHFRMCVGGVLVQFMFRQLFWCDCQSIASDPIRKQTP